MKLLHLSTGPLKVNSYFLINENNECVLIDSGENYNAIKKVLADNGLSLSAVLLTHGHFDHCGNVKKLQDDGAKIYVSEKDGYKLKNDDNLSMDFGRKFEYCKADYTFKNEQEITVSGIKIKVLFTPGHTDGSVCYIVNDMLFSGDTLFHESVGRTDFKTGNRNDLITSVKRLFSLDGDYKVFPGHEEFTTLDNERINNGFLDF